jgi:electron transfer flavoprotein beta subunit
MKVLIIVSQVPDTTTKIQIGPDGRSIDETGISWILNPYAEFAIEKALRLREAGVDIEEIVLISMGPDRVNEALRQGLAMGADRAILIKSKVWNTDALTEEIRKLDAQLILAAKKSIDTEMSAVEMGVAAKLDIPVIHSVSKIETQGEYLKVSRELSGELQSFRVKTPVLLTCDKGLDEPRYASVINIMKAKKKPLDEIDLELLDNLGIEIMEASLPAPRSAVKLFDGSPEEAARKLLDALKNEAKVI